MDNHKISISFKADRMHIYAYLKTTDSIKDNISAYICNLIEKDIQNSTTKSLEEQVRNLVQQFIGVYGTDSTLISPQSQSAEVPTDEDIDLINNLF